MLYIKCVILIITLVNSLNGYSLDFPKVCFRSHVYYNGQLSLGYILNCIDISDKKCKEFNPKICKTYKNNYQNCLTIINYNVYDNCVRLYDGENCMGKSTVLHYGQYNNDLQYIDNIVTSIGACAQSNCRNYWPKHNENKVKRNPEQLCNWIPDDEMLGPFPDLTIQRPPSILAGPILSYQQGYGDRIEFVYAVITPRHLRTGTRPTDAMRIFARSLGRPTDQAGHVIASILGGSGAVRYNIFPQDPSTNMGSWRVQEREVCQAVFAGQTVNMIFNFIYKSDNETRPDHFYYRFVFETYEIFDACENP